MTIEVPTLPPGDELPSAAELAELLSRGFPAADADAARRLLADEILAWDLRSRDTHPAPRRLTELAYAGVADQLRGVAPAARLARLDEMACDREAGRLVERSVSLAVARYLRDRGVPPVPGLEGYLEPARPLVAMSPAEAETAVDTTRAAWERWRARAERVPGCRERHRLDQLHADTALGSARSGSFASASGPFHAFLVQAGEHPSLLDVH